MKHKISKFIITTNTQLKYLDKVMSMKEIEAKLIEAPISFSKISVMLADSKFIIRAKGRAPIPEKFREPLSELVEFFDGWKDKYCKLMG